MNPSLFLGVDKSASPQSVQNQLRRKRSEIARRVDASQLQKFDTLVQKPNAWDDLFAWGDKNGIWIGSREDFEEYNPVSEARVDKDGHMKLSPKQKMIARMAGNPNKIDAPDFAALRAKRQGCTCGTSKGVCKKCASEYGDMKTESKAEQVVNRLVGESDMDLLATMDPKLAGELGGGMKSHEETDMSNPEERTEVQIAHDILDACDKALESGDTEDVHQVMDLARELLAMHGQADEEEEGEEGHEASETAGEEKHEHDKDDDFEEVG
jgi:hypothetical protein